MLVAAAVAYVLLKATTYAPVSAAGEKECKVVHTVNPWSALLDVSTVDKRFAAGAVAYALRIKF